MSFTFNPNWHVHPSVPGKHTIKCARCYVMAQEAGIIEAYTVRGEGNWPICNKCLARFIKFMARQEEHMPMTDNPFSVLYIDDLDDVDVAEHHALCSCYDCLVDPDEYRKFELENRDNITAERRTA